MRRTLVLVIAATVLLALLIALAAVSVVAVVPAVVAVVPVVVPVVPVPRRIVQTWKTLDLGRLEPVSRTWRTRNPDFAYTLYDDAACARTVAQLGPRVEQAYARIGPGAFKADLWRYCELYVSGGVYADVDTVCLSAIDAVVDPTATLAVPIDLTPPNLFNAFVAVRPGHPVMRACIDAVVENVERGAKQTGLSFSGPGLLGACVARFLGTSSFEPGIVDQPDQPATIRDRTQLLRFEPVTEIVSSAGGVGLMQNKNGNSGIYAAYEAEARRAAVVRYEM